MDYLPPSEGPSEPTMPGPSDSDLAGIEAPRRRHHNKVLPAALALALVGTAGAGAAVAHLAWAPSSTKTTTGDVYFPGGYGGGYYVGGGTDVPGYEGNTGSGSLGIGSGSTTVGQSNAAAIAAKVQDALVDIDTNLSYEQEQAAGTGIVLTSNGEILTNNHVIDGATSISVTDVGNGKTYNARIVGYDATRDVAVLQLQNASGLKTAKLADSSAVKVGDEVVGVGNAGGTGGTPSSAGGTITGVGQSITASDEGSSLSEHLTGMLATNADIQPGDSGGSLVNSKGEVIGIDTAGESSSGTFGFTSAQSSATTGYAIPINTALTIAKQIESSKSSSTVHIGATAFLGVGAESVSATSSTPFGGFGGYAGNSSAGSNGTSTTPGAEIANVVANGAAAKAGLTAGDVITSLSGHSIASPSALGTVMQQERPGATVAVTYTDTSGVQHTVNVTLASGPPQ